MIILATKDIPLKQFPLNASAYCTELQDWLQTMADKGLRYTGAIGKTVGKQYFLVHTFVKDSSISQVKAIDSASAGILNYPSSESSLAKSVSESFASLLKLGWYYSASYPKKIGTSNYSYLIFYKHKKSPPTKQQGETDKDQG